MKLAKRWIALASIAILGAVAVPSAHAAASHPTANFSFVHNHISAGTAPSVRYAFTNVPAGSQLKIQRQFGTAHVWKSIQTVSSSSGTVAAPKVGLGIYIYRVIIAKNGKITRASGAKHLYSYGKVFLSTLCRQKDSGDADCESGTEQVGNTVFSYQVLLDNDVYPDFEQSITLNRTSCRSLLVKFANDADQTNYVKVVQSASDAKTVTGAPQQIATAIFALDGGPFYLETASTEDGFYYASGYASCYTASGRR